MRDPTQLNPTAEPQEVADEYTVEHPKDSLADSVRKLRKMRRCKHEMVRIEAIGELTTCFREGIFAECLGNHGVGGID